MLFMQHKGLLNECLRLHEEESVGQMFSFFSETGKWMLFPLLAVCCPLSSAFGPNTKISTEYTGK